MHLMNLLTVTHGVSIELLGCSRLMADARQDKEQIFRPGLGMNDNLRQDSTQESPESNWTGLNSIVDGIPLRTPRDFDTALKESTKAKILRWIIWKWRLLVLETNEIPNVIALRHYDTRLSAKTGPSSHDVYLLARASYFNTSKFVHYSLFTQGHCYHLSVMERPQSLSHSGYMPMMRKGLRSRLKHIDLSTPETEDFRRIIANSAEHRPLFAYTVGMYGVLDALALPALIFWFSSSYVSLQVRPPSHLLRFLILRITSSTAWVYTIYGQQIVRSSFLLCSIES